MDVAVTLSYAVLPGEVDQLISQFGSSVRIGGGPSSSLEGARRQAELQMARNRVAEAQSNIVRHNDSKAVFFREMLHQGGPQRVSKLDWLTVPVAPLMQQLKCENQNPQRPEAEIAAF